MEEIVNSGNCSQAQLIYTNAFFLITQFTLLAVNAVGIVLCSCVSLLIITSQVFHLNLRILIMNMYIAVALRTICTTWRSSRNIWMAFAYLAPCEYLSSRQQCILSSTFCAAPLPVIMFSFLAIAIERIFALIFYLKYERFNIPVIAIVLTPATYVKAILQIISLF
uniref:G_PROTEIN_RECEP_F1_2 domain-containing protein n=1 Tax=Parascaris univalens TaxID=6257 RepID=A0A915B3N5_PARUN